MPERPSLRTRVRRWTASPAVVLASGRGVASLLSFGWLSIAARLLPLSDLAGLALLLSVGSIASVVADGSLPLILSEAVAAEPDSAFQAYRLVLRQRARALLVAAPIAVGAVLLAAGRGALVPSLLLVVSLGATTVYTTSSAALRGRGSVAAEAWNESGSRLGILLLGSAALAWRHSLTAAAGAYALMDVASAVVMARLARQRLPNLSPPDLERFRRNRTIPLAATAILGTMLNRIDVWLLGLLSAASDVAAYGLSYRLFDAMMLVGGVAAVLMAPRTARLSFDEAVRTGDRTAATVGALVMMPALVLVIFPRHVQQLLFGSAAVAPTTLRLLAIAAPLATVSVVWSSVLALRTRALLPVTVVSLLLNVALNLAWIPKHGSDGAAAATLAVQLLSTIGIRAALANGSRRTMAASP